MSDEAAALLDQLFELNPGLQQALLDHFQIGEENAV
jgi:hypothetical protein